MRIILNSLPTRRNKAILFVTDQVALMGAKNTVLIQEQIELRNHAAKMLEDYNNYEMPAEVLQIAQIDKISGEEVLIDAVEQPSEALKLSAQFRSAVARIQAATTPAEIDAVVKEFGG